MTQKILPIIIICLSISCNDSKEKELKIKEKELELKEKELDYKISQSKEIESVYIQENNLDNKVENYDSSLSNINNLLGNWESPENDRIHMFFERDGSFEFQDLNFSNKKYEKLYGKYLLKNGKLTLMYNDRAQQTFNFIKEGNNIVNFYIKKGNYLLVKKR